MKELPAAGLGVQRAFLDETQLVPPRIGDIERPLSPGTLDHFARRQPVHMERCQRLQRLGASVQGVDVVNGEVDRLPTRCGFQATLGNVEYREDDAAAVKIVASAGV